MTEIRLPGPAADALARGQLIEAVKIVRQASGLGLKDAHDLVQRYQQQVMRGLPNASGAIAAAAPPPNPGGFVFPQEASAALAQGDLIQAIAALRRANPQLDLKSAKQAIDNLRSGGNASTPAALRQGSARIPTVVEGDRGGHVPILIALVVVVIAIAWWFGSP